MSVPVQVFLEVSGGVAAVVCAIDGVFGRRGSIRRASRGDGALRARHAQSEDLFAARAEILQASHVELVQLDDHQVGQGFRRVDAARAATGKKVGGTHRRNSGDDQREIAHVRMRAHGGDGDDESREGGATGGG